MISKHLSNSKIVTHCIFGKMSLLLFQHKEALEF